MSWLYITLLGLSAFGSATAKEDTKSDAIIKGAGSFHLRSFIEKNIAHYTKIYCCPCFEYKADKCHGSREGREALYASKVSFAGSDIPAPAHERERQPDVLLNIPIVFSALALVYHLPTDDPQCHFPSNFVLSLTAEDIIDIFLKKERVSWASLLNKPYNNIPYRGTAQIHPIAPLPSSGLRELLASLISTAYHIFPSNMREEHQRITTSPDVSKSVKETPGSLGYTTFPQARYHKTKIAQIQSSGNSTVFIAPSIESIQLAAQESCQFWQRVACPEEESGAYPLTFAEYLIVFSHQPSEFIACNLAQFIYFVITEGQKLAQSICLVPLPEECVKENLRLLDKICPIICRPCLPPCSPCKPKVRRHHCECRKVCKPCVCADRKKDATRKKDTGRKKDTRKNDTTRKKDIEKS